LNKQLKKDRKNINLSVLDEESILRLRKEVEKELFKEVEAMKEVRKENQQLK
jgi:hypothetical protein